MSIFDDSMVMSLFEDSMVVFYAACPFGRFDGNCAKECHCRNGSEQCDSTTGECISGCHPVWTGTNCQRKHFKQNSHSF